VLFLFTGNGFLLAALIGHARAGMGAVYISQGTYVTLMIPMFCALYFAWQLYSESRVGPLPTMVLFTTVTVLVPGNVAKGLSAAEWTHDHATRVERDIAAHLPALILAERYLAPEASVTDDPAVVYPTLRHLRDSKMGVFRHLRADPEFQKVTLPLKPTATKGMTWSDGVAYGTAGSRDSSLRFSLGSRQFVYAIRLRVSYWDTAFDSALLRVRWEADGDQTTHAGSGLEFQVEIPTN